MRRARVGTDTGQCALGGHGSLAAGKRRGADKEVARRVVGGRVCVEHIGAVGKQNTVTVSMCVRVHLSCPCD